MCESMHFWGYPRIITVIFEFVKNVIIELKNKTQILELQKHSASYSHTQAWERVLRKFLTIKKKIEATYR